jgi:Ca2+-binding EF-hand superfamily protein
MGNKSSGGAIKKKDMDAFVKSTHFDQDEILALHEHFAHVASRGGNLESIDRTLFLQSLGARSAFVDRMFTIFDTDRNDRVMFGEYVQGLSVLCARGTLDEKVRFLFAIYDLDGDGKISKKDLSDMLRVSMEENEVKMTPKQVNAIIDSTFAEADTNQDGFVDLAEFRVMTDNHRSILSNMTLDFKGLIEARQKEMAVSA